MIRVTALCITMSFLLTACTTSSEQVTADVIGSKRTTCMGDEAGAGGKLKEALYDSEPTNPFDQEKAFIHHPLIGDFQILKSLKSKPKIFRDQEQKIEISFQEMKIMHAKKSSDPLIRRYVSSDPKNKNLFLYLKYKVTNHSDTAIKPHNTGTVYPVCNMRLMAGNQVLLEGSFNVFRRNGKSFQAWSNDELSDILPAKTSANNYLVIHLGFPDGGQKVDPQKLLPVDTIEFTISPYLRVEDMQAHPSELKHFIEGGDIKIPLEK